MTNDLLYLLLRASINASLSDRDAFIEKVSSTLLLRQLFTPRRDKKLTQTLDQLTTAVEKLNALLEDSSFPPQPSKPEEQ